MRALFIIFLVLWAQSYLFFWPQTVANVLRGREVPWFNLICGVLGIVGVLGAGAILRITGGGIP